MFLSIEWLSNYLNLDGWTADEIAETMSRTGLEIEMVHNLGQSLNNLVVGEIKECVPHTNSDRLSITQVDTGDGLKQIICGAPNVVAGQKVIVALPGAVLPGDFKIKESKLRGELSQGMICSLEELGFSDNVVPKAYSDGIFVLPEDAPVGESAIDYLKLDDPVLELDITPNRADALSIRGAAYELGAIVKQTPQFDQVGEAQVVEDTGLEAIKVVVEDDNLSPQYQLRLIKNVTIKESPIWLQIRLMKSGIRPINNVVDVTNYFLLLYGQPMHSFDYDRLPNKEIRVALATEGMKFTTLDDKERTLTAEDVLICSGDEPVGLAGVMGGLETEVTDKTTNVLLETAVFDPQHVRSTSKRFGLRSESSARFEKGINLETINQAGEEAATLIAQLGKGQLVDGVVEHKTLEVKPVEVEVNKSALPNKIGIELSDGEIQDIFDRLGFGVSFKEDTFTVTVPPRRWDISIEADILEEIARIYGYNNIPTTLPRTSAQPGSLTARQKLIRQTRNVLEGLKLNQVISYILTSKKHAQLMRTQAPLVELNFPMSEERTTLRQSMFPAMIEIAKFNRARQNHHLAFYETGRVFFGEGENKQPREEERLAILVSEQEEPATWYQDEKMYDFYSLKGIVESYFEAIRISDYITYQPSNEIEELHPGRTAKILLDGESIGVLGQIHPNIAKEYDLDHATFFMELDLEALIDYHREDLVQQTIPKFPSTSRDLALLVSKDQTHAELVDLIQSQAGKDLKSVELFDQYVGENISEDKQSLAYHLTFQDPERTLTDDDVNQAMDAIIKALEKTIGAEVR